MTTWRVSETLMKSLALMSLFCAFLFIVFGTYNMLRMGKFIKPGSPTVQGRYKAWPRDEDFVDLRGTKFRKRSVVSFLLSVFFLFLFCVMIADIPNFQL